MEVHKFGGTSLGTLERIRKAAALLKSQVAGKKGARVVVVASAMGGVTELLVEAVERALAKDEGYKELVEEVRRRHEDAGSLEVSGVLAGVQELLHGIFLLQEASLRARDAIICAGELLSAPLLARELGDAPWVDARTVLRTDACFGDATPDLEATREALRTKLPEAPFVVVTGFVGATSCGLTTTLGRSGSDYSATVLAACLDARRCVIWTDVCGVLSANPRVVPTAFTLPKLSFQEASELAYFGAKVLHPKTMMPLRGKLCLEIRNTMDPEGAFTRISDEASDVRAVTSLEGVGIVMVEGAGLPGSVGFAARVFASLAKASVSVIMIAQASSEQSLCLVVSGAALSGAVQALREEFALEQQAGLVDRIEPRAHMAVVALVGDGMSSAVGVATDFFRSLSRAGVNVVAIAQAASERNISIIVADADVRAAVNAVHAQCCGPPSGKVLVALIGLGGVGRAFADMLPEHMVLVGTATSKTLAWNVSGALPEARQVDDAAAQLCALCAPFGDRMVLVDASASEEVPRLYEALLDAGCAVVTPNKRGNTLEWELFERLSHYPRYRYESTVLAGLPVISTLQDLVLTGDEVVRVEGVFSGTLGYIFGRLREGASFSSAVVQARELGFTEPDPRDDLNGVDVARKLLIVARILGVRAELSEIEIESLVPEALNGVSVDDFLKRLPEVDDAWKSKGTELAYMATYVPGEPLKVGVVESSLRLEGADNFIKFTTRRYPRGLVVQGAGAGGPQTAAGMLSDVMRLF